MPSQYWKVQNIPQFLMPRNENFNLDFSSV